MSDDLDGELAGGCNCGSVRYTLAPGFRMGPYVCHCTDCQTRTGSAFSEHMMVFRMAITSSGEQSVGRSTNPGGAVVTLYGCAMCGARLWGENDQRPGMATLRCGTLDRSTELEPLAHLWVRSKQAWIGIPEDMTQMDEQPRTNEEWLALLGPKA